MPPDFTSSILRNFWAPVCDQTGFGANDGTNCGHSKDPGLATLRNATEMAAHQWQHGARKFHTWMIVRSIRNAEWRRSILLAPREVTQLPLVRPHVPVWIGTCDESYLVGTPTVTWSLMVLYFENILARVLFRMFKALLSSAARIAADLFSPRSSLFY